MYENLEVKFIPGHNPDLVVYEKQKEVKRIDLKNVKTKSKIESLLSEHKIYKKRKVHESVQSQKPMQKTTFPTTTQPKKIEPDSECKDMHAKCHEWAQKGFCSNQLHQKMCRMSCGLCQKVEL